MNDLDDVLSKKEIELEKKFKQNYLISYSYLIASNINSIHELYGNNECQIYFMRAKSEKDKSFVTIEVRNNKIIQARARFNEEPSKEIMGILRKWERTLLLVESE